MRSHRIDVRSICESCNLLKAMKIKYSIVQFYCVCEWNVMWFGCINVYIAHGWRAQHLKWCQNIKQTITRHDEIQPFRIYCIVMMCVCLWPVKMMMTKKQITKTRRWEKTKQQRNNNMCMANELKMLNDSKTMMKKMLHLTLDTIQHHEFACTLHEYYQWFN